MDFVKCGFVYVCDRFVKCVCVCVCVCVCGFYKIWVSVCVDYANHGCMLIL